MSTSKKEVGTNKKLKSKTPENSLSASINGDTSTLDADPKQPLDNTAELAALERKIEELTVVNQEYISEKDKLERQIADQETLYMAQIKELEARMTDLSSEQFIIKQASSIEQLEHEKTYVADPDGALEQLRHKEAVLLKTIEEKELENQRLKTQLENLHEIHEENQQLKDLKIQNEEVISAKDAEIARYKEQHSSPQPNSEAQELISEYQREITELRKQFLNSSTDNERLREAHSQSLASVSSLQETNAESEAILRLKSRITELEDAAIARCYTETALAFSANSKARETRAVDAIALLEKEIVGNVESNRNKAIQTIVARLREGLKNTDPKTYFDTHKEELRSQVRTLNNWKSIAATAINAILTVLAVCSVVGITALWLTGTLDNNLSKRGSIFAFTAADKQKANRALYEVEQSLDFKIGG